MGAAAPAIPYILTALGTGISAKQSHDVAKQQDQEAAAGIRLQGATQAEANNQVNAQIDELAKSNANADREAANADFMTQLQRSRGVAQASTANIPGASARYAGDVASADLASQATGAKVADLMARINAPSLQRQREALTGQRTGVNLEVLQRRSAGDDFLRQLRQRSIHANPWVSAGASLLSGAGAGMASRVPTDTSPLQEVTITGARRVPTYGYDPRLVMHTTG
jgi:hypothetical protein